MVDIIKVMREYPTNLTDKQRQSMKDLFEPREKRRKNPLRGIVNALLYITKTGCQWRMLPGDFAPWQTVYFYSRKWKQEGVFEELMYSVKRFGSKILWQKISVSWYHRLREAYEPLTM